MPKTNGESLKIYKEIETIQKFICDGVWSGTLAPVEIVLAMHSIDSLLLKLKGVRGDLVGFSAASVDNGKKLIISINGPSDNKDGNESRKSSKSIQSKKGKTKPKRKGCN